MTSFATTNSVFILTNETISFSISIPGCLRILNYLEDGIFDKLKILLKLSFQNDIKLRVEEVRKRGKQIKNGDKEFSLSDLDISKKPLEELKSANYHNPENLVYKMGLAYEEVIDESDIKKFPSERTCFTLLPGALEISVINKTLE